MTKIGIASMAFYSIFKSYYPQLTVVSLKEESVEEYDLIIFPGGEDISPEIYEQENSYAYGISPARDTLELAVLIETLKSKKTKILGVCRGHQLINAFLGVREDFIQDIRTQLKENHGGRHELMAIQENSVISRYFSHVNSMHHQGILSAGVGLIITSKFGSIVESTENSKIITTQFHPEFMDKKDFFEYLEKEWITLPILEKDILYDNRLTNF